MSSVTARLDVPYAMSAAEALWYDATRWPSFLDGFGRVERVDERWPQTGTVAVWATHPGGRGRVTETVLRYEPRAECVTAVEDDTITGEQTMAFTPREGGTKLRLTLDYRIKARTPLTPVVDLFFVRRAQMLSLQRTLYRFAQELRGDHDLAR